MLTLNAFALDSADIADHPVLSDLYDEDGVLEVYFVASARAEQCDYGVPRSPVWYEVGNIIIDEFEVNDKCLSYKELERRYGKAAAEYLDAICIDVADAAELGEWEE